MTNSSGTNNRKPNTAEMLFQILLLLLGMILPFSKKIIIMIGLQANEVFFYVWAVHIIMWITYFCVLYKKKGIALLYILPILVVLGTGIFFHNERINDLFYRFEKKDNIIGVIIPDFKSPTKVKGVNFSTKLFEQLKHKIDNPLTITVGDSLKILDTLIVKINTQRVNEVWDEKQMEIRGKRRKATLGVTGEYKRYYKSGQYKEEIKNFRITILDSLIANIFKDSKPFGQIYDFETNIAGFLVDSTKLQERAALPVEYIINMAGNSKLLQQAIRLKHLKGTNKPLNQTLEKLHSRLTKLGDLIGNPSLAYFHHGNSLVRAAMNSQLDLTTLRRLYMDATIAYRKSIDSSSILTSKAPLKQDYPEGKYLNLAWTYMKLDSLTGNSEFKDSAAAVYDAVVTKYQKRETLEEQYKFLAERCEEEFINQKVLSRIKHATKLFTKYNVCAEKLEIEIRTKSRHLSDEDQKILNTIADNKKLFEAHLKKLKRLRPGV